MQLCNSLCLCTASRDELLSLFLFLCLQITHSAWSESVRRGIAVQFPVHGGSPKCRRLTDWSADLVVAEHRGIAEIWGLENPETMFLPKWRGKQLLVSVFTSFLNSTSPIWSKRTLISMRYADNVLRYLKANFDTLKYYANELRSHSAYSQSVRRAQLACSRSAAVVQSIVGQRRWRLFASGLLWWATSRHFGPFPAV